MILRISDILDGIDAPDYLAPAPDDLLEQRLRQGLLHKRRFCRPFRMGFLIAALSILLLTGTLAAGWSLAQWIRQEIRVPEDISAYTEYEGSIFHGQDFDLSVVSAASGERFAQVFVALTGLPEESAGWEFHLQKDSGQGLVSCGSAAVMAYMPEDATLLLELSVPMEAQNLQLGLSYTVDKKNSWVTKFNVTLPETVYLSIPLSLPAEGASLSATADSVDISLNSISLHLNVKGAQENYEIHSNRASYPKAVWDGNEQDYESWQGALLEMFSQMTVHFADDSSRNFTLAWQTAPGKNSICILHCTWTRDFLDLNSITAITVGGVTFPAA